MSNPEPLLTCRQAKSGTETTAISGAVTFVVNGFVCDRE